MGNERKWSPNEAKVLAFAKERHAGQTRIHGDAYINHPKRVAEYLYDLKYRGKYTFTAFCHDLIEDTNTTEEEILNLGGRFTRDAVVLLTKHKGVDIADYLDKIKKNEVAYIVKVADRIDNLRDALKADLEFIKQYLEETEEYYLDFALESPFFEDLLGAYDSLEEYYDNEYYYEKKKLIVVEVEDAYKAVNGNEYLNILDGFFYGEGSEESFPIACILNKDEIDFAKARKGKKLAIRFLASPTSDINIYKDEETYYKEREPDGFASRSFVPSWLLIESEGLEIPDPNACFTGFVKKVYDPSLNEKDDEDVNNYVVDLYTLGMIISVDLGENIDKIPEVGNIISGVYRIYGSVNKDDQDIQDENEVSNIVTRYWVSGSGDEYKSALKVIASPKDIKLIHYNSNSKEGKEVEGANFYEISVGMNFDYDTISEEGFLEFIKTL